MPEREQPEPWNAFRDRISASMATEQPTEAAPGHEPVSEPGLGFWLALVLVGLACLVSVLLGGRP